MAENFRISAGNSSENGREHSVKTIKTIHLADWRQVLRFCSLLAVLALESVYSIGEQEQGVVTTFGNAGSVVTSQAAF